MTILYGPQMVDGLVAPKINMVPIQGGTFQMGAGSGPITLSGFQMGVNPVTNQQYGSVANGLDAARYFAMAADPASRRPILIARGDDPGKLNAMDAVELLAGLRKSGMIVRVEHLPIFAGALKVFEVKEHRPPEGFDGSNQPAVMVRWYGAFAFSDLLRMITGVDYALPTEFQWEWAARGPSGREYATSTGELSPDVAHYRYDDSVVSTIDVDDPRYPSMENGLRHMTGNVWEWMLNWHGDLLPQEAVRNPIGPESGQFKSLRGGSWFYYVPVRLCAAYRFNGRPVVGNNRFGFRVVAPQSVHRTVPGQGSR